MIAVVRYQLALLGHSQRYLPPVLAFGAVLAMVYTEPDAPTAPEIGISTAALVIVACWLTVALLDIEEPDQRLVTRAHAGGMGPVVAGVVLTVLGVCVLLTAGSLGWSAFVHGRLGAEVLALGLLAHLAGACAGVAVGLPCSRLLVAKLGYTVAAGLAALAVVLLVEPVPLVNPMLRALGSDRGYESATGIAAAVCALALTASACGVGALARRRG